MLGFDLAARDRSEIPSRYNLSPSPLCTNAAPCDSTLALANMYDTLQYILNFIRPGIARVRA